MQTRPRTPRLIGLMVKANMTIAGFTTVVMLLHVVSEFTMRYLFQSPFSGTLEIVSYWYMVSLVFLAIPVAQAKSEHIKVELFTAAIPVRVRAGLDAVVLVASALLLGLIGWVSVGEAMRQTARWALVEAGTVTIAVWPTYWLVPFSMFSTALVCIVQAVFEADSCIHGHKLPAAEQTDGSV